VFAPRQLYGGGAGARYLAALSAAVAIIPVACPPASAPIPTHFLILRETLKWALVPGMADEWAPASFRRALKEALDAVTQRMPASSHRLSGKLRHTTECAVHACLARLRAVRSARDNVRHAIAQIAKLFSVPREVALVVIGLVLDD
jgi:hypothetical protein